MATINFFGGRVVLGTEFAGYKISIFDAGTSTAKTTYKESALTTANVHPVVLDANGAAQIWFSGNAKAILYTAADAVVYTDDNVNLESSSSATGADNLILNNSFEDDADGDGIPDNWTRTLYTGGAFTVDTTTQSHGDTSAKFTSTGTGGGYLTSTATYGIRPSTSYSVGVNLKSSVADVRNVVEILWYKADGTASATASTTLLDDSTTNPTSWTENWYETSSPSDAYFAKIRLTGCHSSDATSGSTWFDDITFTAGVIRRAKTTLTNTLTMSGPVSISDGAAAGTSQGHGQCKLTKSGSNLLLLPFDGNRIVINSLLRTIPDAGVSLAPTSLAASTVYYIYAYMVSTTVTLEASTTAYAIQTGTGVYTKSGDVTRTLVGMARTTSGTAWADSATQRFVLSYFNRRNKNLANNFTADRTTTSATFVEMNTEIRCEFVTWEDESIAVGYAGSVRTSGNNEVYAAIGIDNTTAVQGVTTTVASATVACGHTHNYHTTLSEGYHYATVLGLATGGVTATFLHSGSHLFGLHGLVRG